MWSLSRTWLTLSGEAAEAQRQREGEEVQAAEPETQYDCTGRRRWALGAT